MTFPLSPSDRGSHLKMVLCIYSSKIRIKIKIKNRTVIRIENNIKIGIKITLLIGKKHENKI